MTNKRLGEIGLFLLLSCFPSNAVALFFLFLLLTLLQMCPIFLPFAHLTQPSPPPPRPSLLPGSIITGAAVQARPTRHAHAHAHAHTHTYTDEEGRGLHSTRVQAGLVSVTLIRLCMRQVTMPFRSN